MSLAAKIHASKKAAKADAEARRQEEALNNRQIAKVIMKAKKNKEKAFPSNEIESLREIAQKVVAANFEMYPELAGVEDMNILEEITKLTRKDLPITVVARNIDFEDYW